MTSPAAPATTGANVQSMMAHVKAGLVARYRLHVVPGRPEELISKTTGAMVSLGYGCKTVRVRKHGEGRANREWVDYIDVQIKEDWHKEIYEFLDHYFGWVSKIRAPRTD